MNENQKLLMVELKNKMLQERLNLYNLIVATRTLLLEKRGFKTFREMLKTDSGITDGEIIEVCLLLVNECYSGLSSEAIPLKDFFKGLNTQMYAGMENIEDGGATKSKAEKELSTILVYMLNELDSKVFHFISANYIDIFWNIKMDSSRKLGYNSGVVSGKTGTF